MITRTKYQQFNPYLFSIHGRVIWGDRLQVSSLEIRGKWMNFTIWSKVSLPVWSKSVSQCSIMKINYLTLFDLDYRDIMPYAVETAVFRVDRRGHVLRSFPGHSSNSNVGITGMHVLYGNTCLHFVIYSQSNFT